MTCVECIDSCGVLVGQEYARYEFPPYKLTPIQRCDACEKFEGDLDAAADYAVAMKRSDGSTWLLGWHAPADGSSIIACAGDVWATQDPRAAGPMLVDDNEEE